MRTNHHQDSGLVVSAATEPQGLAQIQHRDGVTYVHERDGTRLAAQHIRVLECLRSGSWWTLQALSDATGDPEASVSARLRDLRKERFGSHEIERRYVRRGLWEYRLMKRDLFE
jgi:hypothetical protein